LWPGTTVGRGARLGPALTGRGCRLGDYVEAGEVMLGDESHLTDYSLLLASR
jgi:hypothetical protein